MARTVNRKVKRSSSVICTESLLEEDFSVKYAELCK